MQRNVNHRMHLLSNSPAFKRGTTEQRTALSLLVLFADSAKRHSREKQAAKQAAMQNTVIDIDELCDAPFGIQASPERNTGIERVRAFRNYAAPAVDCRTQSTFIIAYLQSASKTVRAVKQSRVKLYSKRQALATYGAAANPNGNDFSDF